MKLIIDIPEEVYNTLQRGSVVDDAILNGIPLEDIKAEIQEKANERWGYPNIEYAKGLETALSIIDKYMAESEDKE